MNKEQLAAILTDKKYAVQITDQLMPFTGACAVLMGTSEDTAFNLLRQDPYKIGMADGSDQPFLHGETVSVTVNYSAHKRASSCSCSGGPGTIATPVECFEFTGLLVQCWFWNWDKTRPSENKSQYYQEYVPLFAYLHQEDDLLARPEEITPEAYQQAVVNALPVDAEDSFFSNWARNEQNELLYWYEVDEAFAVCDPLEHTAETIVLPVYLRQKRSIWEGSYDNRPIEYHFYKQYMHVYTSAFKAFDGQTVDEKLRARKYYYQPTAPCL